LFAGSEIWRSERKHVFELSPDIRIAMSALEHDIHELWVGKSVE
jgi:hypothetical protein